MKARGHSAVMASRQEPPDSLDFFPTPPWSTRALFEHVLGNIDKGKSCWEPAAGLGHMSGVLEEYFDRVVASDVFDYRKVNHVVGSFIGTGPDVLTILPSWTITNPPFRLATEFAERALDLSSDGVALLVRSVWAEGGDRYRRLFERRPPSIIAQFCERVPMVKGRWDPKASTATSYAWFVWLLPRPPWISGGTYFQWIPPGCREKLTKPDDVLRFTAAGASTTAPLPANEGEPAQRKALDREQRLLTG